MVLNADLLAKCQTGDQDAWRQFKEAIWPWLIGLLVRRVNGNQELAEEIAQRTLIALQERDCQRLKRYDANRGALATFLFAVARRELNNELRNRTTRREVPLQVCPPAKLAVSPCYFEYEMKELAESLPPQLSFHLTYRCLSNPGNKCVPYISGPNSRQLDHRIREKMGVRLRPVAGHRRKRPR
jgi:DNA-directed RNA polymerase specialized sigma24 family protein